VRFDQVSSVANIGLSAVNGAQASAYVESAMPAPLPTLRR
jgi:hypothetical protein